MAFATGENDSTLTVYSVPQFPTTSRTARRRSRTRPSICYRYSGPNGHYSTPTFAPDGGRLAWAEDDGIKVVTVPSFAGGCTLDGATPNAPLVIPGGSQPDWGPADVPAGRGPSGGGLKAKAVKTKLATRAAQGLRPQGDGALRRPREGHGDRPRPQGRLGQQAREGRQGDGQAALHPRRPQRARTTPAASSSASRSRWASKSTTLSLKLKR